MEQEEKTASKRRKTLERELEWVRMAPKARQAKGKARLNSYDKLLNEDVKEKEEKLEIFIPNGPRLGNKVIEAKHVAKAFGDKLLFDDLNFMLPPNGIVGIIGPNGAEDYAFPSYHGTGKGRQRRIRGGGDRKGCLRGPAAQGYRPQQERISGHFRRKRSDSHGRARH